MVGCYETIRVACKFNDLKKIFRLRVALELYENTGAVTNTDKISTHDYFEFWYDNYVKTNLSKNTQLNYRHVLDKYVQPDRKSVV